MIKKKRLFRLITGRVSVKIIMLNKMESVRSRIRNTERITK